MKKKWKVVFGSFLVLLLVAGIVVALAVRGSLEAVNDSYAQWDAAIAIINHMETHDHSWPTDWDELEESCKSTPDWRGFMGFDNFKARVEIDFTAQPSYLRSVTLQKDKPPFKVVWLRNGNTSHWAGAEPNTLIHEYLTKDAGNILKAAPEE